MKYHFYSDKEKVSRQFFIHAFKFIIYWHCQLPQRTDLENKKLVDHDRLIPTEYLNKWFKCDYIQVIASLKDSLPHSMTQLAASSYRNSLLLHTSITNLKRTGIYESITLSHIDKGKRMPDGSLCLLVSDGRHTSPQGQQVCSSQQRRLKH